MPANDNRLELLLLGRPLIRLGGQELDKAPPSKSQALLYYLAATGQPATRETLAALLWGDMPEAAARANLRLALSRLRRVVGDCLIQERQTVAFDFEQAAWVDVRAFAQTLHGGRTHSTDALRTATNLYRGAFLADFSTPDAPAFETWIVTEREWFHQLMLAGLRELLAADRAGGHEADAINVARRMLEVAPWCEEAHQDLIELLARTGQRSAALAQYEICRRLLDEELGVPPSAKTEQLRAQVADGTLAGGDRHSIEVVDSLPVPGGPPLEPVERRVQHAPHYPDPLLGRGEAIAQVQALLADPTCRLLTLVGAGGVGKTRLALAATADLAAHYTHGAYFIPFASIKPARQDTSADLVISGIGNALGYTFDAQQEPHAILLNHLRDKELLLICDNFEQLRPAVALLEEIVLTAPSVQLLVTSRERLGSRHEWLYTVDGLAYAPEATAEPACDYPATALFVRSAQRVRADFDPVAEAECVAQICRLLEGWPLSIELAANWLRLLPSAAIAARLHDDVMLLDAATIAPDDRHRSMRAVLDASWDLLSADERRVCGGVACFRGGFELSAAQAVVRAGLVQLGSLVDKSLLRRNADGRYQMHEQVRQFAAARLNEQPGDVSTIHRRHTAYYAALAAAQETPAGGVPDETSVALFDRELENLRLALEYALGDNDIARVASLLESLLPYFRYKGWNREIVTTMEQACTMTGVPLAVQARWQRWWADALYQMGELHACTDRIEQLLRMVGKPLPVNAWQGVWFATREFSRQILHRLNLRPAARINPSKQAILVEQARALERYGQAGYFLDAQTEFLTGVANINDAESANAHEFLAAGYATVALMLANIAMYRGAAYYQRLALHNIERDTNVAHRAFVLEVIGLNFFIAGNWAAAHRMWEEGVVLANLSARRRFSLEIQMVNAIAFGIPGDYHTALTQAERVLPLARELSDAVVQAWSLLAQAEFCLHVDDNPATRALPLIVQAQALPASEVNKSEHFRIFANLAPVALRTGDTVQAAQALDRSLAILDIMVLPANWAFEGYANVPDTALALLENPDLSPAERRENMKRAKHACAILHKFACAHRFARPRALIFAGILNWQKGRQKRAFKTWQKAAAVAAELSMRYDIARAQFEIGRHLAPQQIWDGHDGAYYLEQARAEFAEIGAGYMLSRIEVHRSQ